MSASKWVSEGRVSYLAFLLRPADANNPIEVDISVGLTPSSAVKRLKKNYGAGRISVGAVHLLPYGLAVTPDEDDDTTAKIFGLPLHSLDASQIGRAMTVASALAGLATLVAIPPAG